MSREPSLSNTLDLGRFLAASLLFYFHLGLPTGDPLGIWWEGAVTFFIIVAGIAYCVYSSAAGPAPKSYGEYVLGRIKAIFPVYLAINGVIFLGSFLYPSSLGRSFTIDELAFSSLSLSQYVGYRYLSAPMWFVPFILQAYLLFPLIDRLLERIPATPWIVGSFLVSLALIVLVFCGWLPKTDEICRNWSPLFRLPEVSLGVILGRCVSNRTSVRSAAMAFAAFGVLAAVLALVLSPRFPAEAYIFSLPWRGLIVAVALGLVSYLSVLCLGRLISPPIFRLMRAASFPFFLAHGVGIGFVFRRFGGNAWAWISYFLVCWALSVLFVIIFERLERLVRAGRDSRREGAANH